MLPIHIALVSDKSSMDISHLTEVSAALQKQVSRDFGPIWHIRADVSAFTSLESVPLDYWPIIIKDDIGDPTAAGYHEDHNGQPFSLVQYADDWTLTASHELLEMLGDPFGRRMVAAESVIPGQGRVQYLVEVCDPSEGAAFAYSINNITVSDFYTPHFFDPVGSGGVRYSFTNAIKHPREVLPGGYLSWYVPKTREWWQRTWFGGAAPTDRQLPPLQSRNGNLRTAIDRLTAEERMRHMRLDDQATAERHSRRSDASDALRARAEDLRHCVGVVTGASSDDG